ncbi:hypothetical protein IY145_14590 [Methylosinus sp. H3A]|uniref:hypothetical protein n=1 Tax=Methylosinus sp. H3A TaxID=2785786 RepID=UPI0018C221A2|nr:hypothetical protein [Methylosinus sp. H3A]MBG0810597.1 hypothetical protein [Methylosinus sp. H3A]
MGLSLSSAYGWLLARAEEPSTWAGTGVLAAIVHSIAPGALGDGVLAAGAALGGLIAVVAPEKKLG